MGGSVPKRLHCKTHTVIASRAATWQSTLQTMQRSHPQQYKPNPSERQALMPAL